MKNIAVVFFTTTLLLLISDSVLGQNAKKWVFLEQFTSTQCPSCGYRNPELYEMILKEYDTEIIHIAYHNNRPIPADPFYQANPIPSEIRTNYYEITASPSLVVNGVKLRADKPLITSEQLEKQLNQNSPLHLKIIENIQTDKERKIQISTKTTAELPKSTYKLFVAVAEKDVFFCTYFEYIFDNVFRTFLSGNLGDEIVLSGNEKSYTYQYTPKTDWNDEQLFVIAFVQNLETKEIVNAISTQPLNTNKTTRYANEAFSLLSTIGNDECGKNKGLIELDICVDTAPMEYPVDLSFEWSNGATTQNIYNLTAGTYSVKITNNVLQTTTEQHYEILGNEKIEVTVNTQADTGSANGAIQVQANGGIGELYIEWNTGDNLFNLNGLQADVYSFVVTDENGCSHQQTIEVKSEIIFNFGEAIVNTQPITCAGKKDGSVSISTTGDVAIDKVVWLLEDKTGNNLEGLLAGTYTFFTIDEAGNKMHEGTFKIEEPAPLYIVTKQSNGFQKPYINIEKVSGGTPPYQYSWSNGSKLNHIEEIEPGEYSLEVTDENKCLLSQKFIIAQNTFNVQSISCFKANDGAIEITVNDGINYAFNWTNGETQASINNLDAGRYGLTVSYEDFTKFLSFDIEEPKLLELALVYDSLNFALRPQLRGGTPPYQFLWSNNTENPVLENPEAGTFSLLVADANECSTSAEIKISNITSNNSLMLNQLQFYPNPIETLAYIDLPIAIKKVQLIDTDGAEHSIPYTPNKSQVQFDFTGLAAGVYLLLLSDEDKKHYIVKALVWR